MDRDLFSVTLRDGRMLEVLAAGPEDSTPLVYHHGSPGARLDFAEFITAVTMRGLRFVSYTRPGYGGSTAQPGRAVGDCAADTAELMDNLGAQSFYTLGWSGGGPHALACAALLGDRVIAAGSIAGLAPYPAEGLDYMAGMAPENVKEFCAALAGPAALRESLGTLAPSLATVDGDQIIAALGELLSDVDQAAVSGAFGEFLAANVRDALRNGIEGWVDDSLAFVRYWGFELASIAVPVTVWHGPHDRMVPFAHGGWLLDHIPGARARLEPEHGHVSLGVSSFERIVDDLLLVSGRLVT